MACPWRAHGVPMECPWIAHSVPTPPPTTRVRQRRAERGGDYCSRDLSDPWAEQSPGFMSGMLSQCLLSRLKLRRDYSELDTTSAVSSAGNGSTLFTTSISTSSITTYCSASLEAATSTVDVSTSATSTISTGSTTSITTTTSPTSSTSSTGSRLSYWIISSKVSSTTCSPTISISTAASNASGRGTQPVRGTGCHKRNSSTV